MTRNEVWPRWALSQTIRAYQCALTRLFSARKLTDLYRKPDRSTES